VDIDVVRPSAIAPEDLAAWSQIQAADPDLGSPFLSPHWALAVERVCENRRGRIVVCMLRDAGQAVGFFVARVVGATAMPVGAPMCDYQALVAAPGVSVTSKQLLEALGVQRLDFCHMLAGRAPFAAFERGQAASYQLDLSQGYEAYAAARREAGSGVIKDIDKRRRKVEREIGEVTFVARSADEAAFDQLLAWKRKQYEATGQTVIFDAPWTVRLLRELRAGPDAGIGGVLFELRIDGKLAAVQYNLLGEGVVHAWIIAHDEAFERYSPGLILFQEIARWMDGTPYRTLDLGAGDYRFKLQLASHTVPVAHGFAGRPSAAALVREAQYGVREAAERLPWPQVAQLPAKAMRRLDVWRGLR
jgi:CelD/BcsL family acetyltransferase involved in cellulose biosynthesis